MESDPRERRVAESGGEPVRLIRYGRARADQPGRAYPSLDRLDLELWPDGQVEGLIERIEPEGRRGALWSCAGRQVLDTFLLTFWPLKSDDGEAAQSNSAGQILVQREISLRRPWLGKFVKLERRQSKPPVLQEYDYWLSPATDRGLVSSVSTVAVLDFDNTMARGWILRPWMDCLAENGVGDARAGVGRLEQLLNDYSSRPSFGHDRLATKAGEIYAESMRGVAARDVQRLAEPFVSDYLGPRGQLFASTREMIGGFRERGLRPVLITGAPGEVTEALTKELEIEHCFPLRLNLTNGVFTGSVASNHGVSGAKATACQWLVDEQECEVAVAVGDSAGDQPLWRHARVSIRVGGPIGASDVTMSGIDMNAALDDRFWQQIPRASWLDFVEVSTR
jgi:phosphoserine phosphatase